MPSSLPRTSGIRATLRSGGILHIVFDTPKTLNSFDAARYEELLALLKHAEKEDPVKAVLLSSTGRFFSSGAAMNERGVGNSASGGNVDTSGAKRYIDALIDFPKLLVAIVQGPAYGIAVTTLPYFDLVYATPEATFTTPFSRIGISLEGCSSVLFPAILGHALSTRLLYLSDTVTVDELAHTGMIAQVLPKESIEETVLKKLETWLADVSMLSVLASRNLVRTPAMRELLHNVNDEEMKVLAERRASDDHKQAIQRFQERKKAKKGAAKL